MTLFMSTSVQNLRQLFKKGKRKEAVQAAIQQFGSDFDAFSSFILHEGWEDLPVFWAFGYQPSFDHWLQSHPETDAEFAEGYFLQRQGKPSFDSGRTSAFLVRQPHASLAGIRKTRRFLQQEFWDLVNTPEVRSLPELEKRLTEFRLLRDRHDQRKGILEQQRLTLASYDFLELLILLGVVLDGLFLESMRDSMSDSLTLQQDVIMSFGLVLEEKLKQGATLPKHTAPDECWKQSLQIIQKCHDRAYLEKFERMAQAFHAWDNFEDQLYAYCDQGEQLVSFPDGHLEAFPPTKAHRNRWNRIGQQYPVTMNYYLRLGQEILESNPPEHWKKAHPLQIASQIAWDDLGFPDQVKVSGKNLDPVEILAWTLALDRNIQERYHQYLHLTGQKFFENGKEIPVAEIISKTIMDRAFQAQIQVGPLNFRTAQEMLLQTRTIRERSHRKANLDQIQDELDFMTLNLDTYKEGITIRLLETPLIRWGNIYCYVSSVIGNKNRVMMLQNRIMRDWYEEENNGEINRKADGYVELIAEEFRQQGFETRIDEKLSATDNRVLTDIDILACKGNTVFVIQAKDTFARYDSKSIEGYRRTLAKAGQQLDESMAYIEAFPDFVPRLFGVESTNEVIHYYPLIVTSTAEGNYEHWGKGGYFKISAFELRIILHNTKDFLIEPVWLMVKTVIKNEKIAEKIYDTLRTDEYAQKKILAYLYAEVAKMDQKLSHFDLWQGEKECKPQHIIEAIENDSVWKGILLEDIGNFPEASDSEEIHEAFLAFQQGALLFKRDKNYKDAIPFFERAIALDPKDFENYCWLADAKAEYGLKEEAILLYDEIIERFPTQRWPYTNQAVTLIELSRYQEAFIRCEQALKLEPQDKESMIMHIRLLLELERWDEYKKAFTDFQRLWPQEERIEGIMLEFMRKIVLEIAKMKPKTAEDFLNRSSHHVMAQDINAALKDANKAIELDPKFSGGWYNRAWLKRQNKMLLEALKDIEKAVSLEPRNVQYAEQHASILKELGNFNRAEKIYKRATSLDPSFALAWYNLGVLYMQQGHNALALKCYKRAFELDPDEEGSAVNYGIMLQRAGRIDEAKAQFLKAVQLGHDSAVEWLLDLE